MPCIGNQKLLPATAQLWEDQKKRRTRFASTAPARVRLPELTGICPLSIPAPVAKLRNNSQSRNKSMLRTAVCSRWYRCAHRDSGPYALYLSMTPHVGARHCLADIPRRLCSARVPRRLCPVICSVLSTRPGNTPQSYLDVARKLGNLLADGGHLTVNGAGRVRVYRRLCEHSFFEIVVPLL